MYQKSFENISKRTSLFASKFSPFEGKTNHISLGYSRVNFYHIFVKSRVSNDRRPGRLVDHESVVDFEILVGRLLNDGQQGGPAGFGTGNGTLTEKNYDLLS